MKVTDQDYKLLSNSVKATLVKANNATCEENEEIKKALRLMLLSKVLNDRVIYFHHIFKCY